MRCERAANGAILPLIMPPDAPPQSDPRAWVERPPLALSHGTVDFARSRFARHDRTIEPLSPREAEVLAFLADRPNRTVPRDELLTQVFGHGDTSLSRAVDTAIARLRRKLEPDPAAPQMLFTEHGTGYRLLVGAAEPSPEAPPPAPRRVMHLRDRRVDLTAGVVEGPAGRVALTAQERQLVEALLRLDGAPLEATRAARVLGMPGLGAVRNAVARLRAKLEAHPARPVHLLTAPGGAYRLEARVAAPAADAEAHRAALVSLTDYVGVVLGLPDCVVYVFEGDALHQRAAFGPKRAPDGGVRAPLIQRVGEGLVGEAARLGQPILCGDTAADARYRPDLVPARGELIVPVLASGVLVGALDAEHPAPGVFTQAHLATFVSLAAIAAPAFARLHRGSHD